MKEFVQNFVTTLRYVSKSNILNSKIRQRTETLPAPHFTPNWTNFNAWNQTMIIQLSMPQNGHTIQSNLIPRAWRFGIVGNRLREACYAWILTLIGIHEFHCWTRTAWMSPPNLWWISPESSLSEKTHDNDYVQMEVSWSFCFSTMATRIIWHSQETFHRCVIWTCRKWKQVKWKVIVCEGANWNSHSKFFQKFYIINIDDFYIINNVLIFSKINSLPFSLDCEILVLYLCALR